MDKLIILVFAGLLGYICLVLTSINDKLELMNVSNAQVAVLNEVKSSSYPQDEIQQIAFHQSMSQPINPVQVGLIIAALISIFVSWHLSRIYHSHEWTKKILSKTFSPLNEPYIAPAKREFIHLDQDCVGDGPLPDGRIKDSWLPPHAKQLYAAWGRS